MKNIQKIWQKVFLILLSILSASIVLPAIAQQQSISNTPAWSSASASATVDQRGMTIVSLKDGRQMSFAEISALKGGEKDVVLWQLGRSDKVKFKEYDLEVANQRIEMKKWVEQAKDQTEKQIDANIQAKDQEFIKRAYEYVTLVENDDKLSNDPKVVAYLERLIRDVSIPQDLAARIEVLIAQGR